MIKKNEKDVKKKDKINKKENRKKKRGKKAIFCTIIIRFLLFNLQRTGRQEMTPPSFQKIGEEVKGRGRGENKIYNQLFQFHKKTKK